MSKKTIVFKMPATESAAARRTERLPRAGATNPRPSSRLASPKRRISNGAEPDQWVRRRDMSVAPTAPAPRSPTSAVKTDFALDLAAERDFGEVVALSLIVPPMLGWFWFAKAVDRYRRIFAG